MESKSLTARFVFTAAGPPLENGIVVVRDDKIEAIEPKGARQADVDLGNVAIIPGLVNAHTHLDLTGARGLIPPTDPDHFTDWLKGVIAYRKTRTAEQVQEDIRVGLAECLKAGATLVGDIASGGASWNSLKKHDVRAIVYRELIGLSDEWQDAYFSANAWIQERNNERYCRKGISPHAPYTVRRILISMVNDMCEMHNLPSTIHVAESPAEMNLIQLRKGDFIPFLAAFQFFEFDTLIATHRELIEFNKSGFSQILVHGNYLDINTPIRTNQSLAYCPRTHAAFGHPPHPFREFQKRGVRVCLGTDSLASNPDLDILAEARFVKERYPDFDGETLLKMVTLFGAEALGWADECGSLEPGKSADFVAVPLPIINGEPYDLLFAHGDHGVRQTMFRGEWRV